MAYPGIADCSTQVADERLLYAGKYASYVHGLEEQSPGMFPVSMGAVDQQQVSMISGLGCGSDCNCSCNNKGVSGLGESKYNIFPPGPRPDPYTWNGWTLIQLDGKWMYRNPNDSRLFVTPSNLYDMMGIPKDKQTGFPDWYPKKESIKSASGAVVGVTVAIGVVAVLFLLKKNSRANGRPGTRKIGAFKPRTIPRHAMTTKYFPRFGGKEL